MNRPGAAVTIACAVLTAHLIGCAKKQPETAVESQSLTIRECVRTRMTSAGFSVTDEANFRYQSHGPSRALVGRTSPASGSLNRPDGPVDMLIVWYSDNHFSPLGYTTQYTRTAIHQVGGGLEVMKSVRLRDLMEKLEKECPGYRQIAQPR